MGHRIVVSLLFACSILGATSVWAATSLTDEFSGDKPDAKWKWSNEPKSWDVGKTKKGWLTVNADLNRNLWANDDTSRLYQEVDLEKFDVETHLVTEFQANSIVAGLVAKSPKDENWVTLKWWGHAAGDAQLQFQTKQREIVARVPDFASQGGVADVFLRMVKDKDTYTVFWKLKEGDKWVPVGPSDWKLTPPLQLGVYAGVDAAAGKLVAQYDYFRDSINPLAVRPVGKAAVTWGGLKTAR
jgi:hypothetical protein